MSESSLPPPIGVSLIQPNGVMVTSPSLPVPGMLERDLRSSHWGTYDSAYPAASYDSGLPPPSGKVFVCQDWSAMVGQLIRAGLAEEGVGGTRLTLPVFVRGIGVNSRPLRALEELQWFVTAHAGDSRVFGGIVEPSLSAGWQHSDAEVMARLRALSAVLATPQATDADRALYGRVLRTAIQRTETSIDSLSRPRASRR